VARDGSIALTCGSATRPPDVVLVSGGQRRVLTWLNAELLDNKRLREVRHIQAASSVDQRPIGRGDAFGGRVEFYPTDPEEEPDPSKWQTDVAFRLADEPAG
jgi:hypothetical protein